MRVGIVAFTWLAFACCNARRVQMQPNHVASFPRVAPTASRAGTPIASQEPSTGKKSFGPPVVDRYYPSMVKGNVVPTKTSKAPKSFGTKFGFAATAGTPPTELHPPAVVKGTAVPTSSGSSETATPIESPEATEKTSFGPTFDIPTGTMVGSGASHPTASRIEFAEATPRVVASMSSRATVTPSKLPEATGKKSFGKVDAILTGTTGASLPTESRIEFAEAAPRVVASMSSRATVTPSKLPEVTGKNSFGTKFGFDSGAKTAR